MKYLIPADDLGGFTLVTIIHLWKQRRKKLGLIIVNISLPDLTTKFTISTLEN